MSPRRLSGWEPVEVTRYEYDDAGRLLAAVTHREPEWSRADVEAMLAVIEMGRVGPHGQPMNEVTSPLANPSNEHREWDYEVDVYTDFAAKRLSEFKRRYKQMYGDDVNLDELRFIVRRVDR